MFYVKILPFIAFLLGKKSPLQESMCDELTLKRQYLTPEASTGSLIKVCFGTFYLSFMRLNNKENLMFKNNVFTIITAGY